MGSGYARGATPRGVTLDAQEVTSYAACMLRSGTATRRVALAAGVGVAVVVALTGCRTEYRGPDADIDGVLWRQVASVEDPFNIVVIHALTPSATEFFAQLPAERWDPSSDSVPDLSEPVAVVYDLESTADSATLSVFFSSGRRSDAPADGYFGPDSVFSCASWRVEFGPYAVERADRGSLGQSWEDCPAELIDAMPGNVAFAEPAVFDG